MRNFNYTKKISLISMYYVETRADKSGYANHRVIGSSFDSEQVFQVSNGYLWYFFEKWADKKLNRPRRWRWRRSDDNSSTFFLRKVELKNGSGRDERWILVHLSSFSRLDPFGCCFCDLILVSVSLTHFPFPLTIPLTCALYDI